jgi:elongation factor G
LFNTGATTRLGSVDEGTSTFDTEAEEIARKSSVSAGIASADYKERRFTLIDTPGSADFVGDTENALRVCDGVILVVSAVDGVEVRTESLWGTADKLKRPRAIFINKLDRDRADFDRALDEIKADLSSSVTPLTIPIGQEADFRGVVSLLSNRAFIYNNMDGSGKYETTEIPEDMADSVASMREQLVEDVAGSDEELMEKYFDEGDLSADDLRIGLAAGIKQGLIFPVFAGSATLNMGVTPLMELISVCFPGADGGEPAVSADGEQSREPSTDAPFSGFVFKTIADQFSGQLSVFRIMSGTISSDGHFLNATSKEKERYGSILSVQGKEQKQLTSASLGDIVAVAKLKKTGTGDTLCDVQAPIVYARTEPPSPIATFAVVAKKKGDEDKIFAGLARLREEDISIHLGREPSTGETLLSGMGQVHIEVVLQKLARKFKVEAEIKLPIIPYRETIRGKVDLMTYRHKKQSGGRGQFGECSIEMKPGERGVGFDFIDNIVGGSIPRQFIPAVEKGMLERMTKGVIAGFPVVDVTVRLFDGKFHAVDSSEMAFKIAGSMAFKNAFEKCRPCLLEPVYKVAITVPKDNVGDVMGDISGRRGRVMGMEDAGKYTTVNAQVALSEIQTYSSDLRSMTSGRGTFTMDFDHYEEVPADLAQKIREAYESDEDE